MDPTVGALKATPEISRRLEASVDRTQATDRLAATPNARSPSKALARATAEGTPTASGVSANVEAGSPAVHRAPLELHSRPPLGRRQTVDLVTVTPVGRRIPSESGSPANVAGVGSPTYVGHAAAHSTASGRRSVENATEYLPTNAAAQWTSMPESMLGAALHVRSEPPTGGASLKVTAADARPNNGCSLNFEVTGRGASLEAGIARVQPTQGGTFEATTGTSNVRQPSSGNSRGNLEVSSASPHGQMGTSVAGGADAERAQRAVVERARQAAQERISKAQANVSTVPPDTDREPKNEARAAEMAANWGQSANQSAGNGQSTAPRGSTRATSSSRAGSGGTQAAARSTPTSMNTHDENQYLKKNVDHLKSVKHQLEGNNHRLEAQVLDLQSRVRGLEQRLGQYKSLYEQAQRDAQCRGVGDLEISSLQCQLGAVMDLKDALNTENVDLRTRLHAAEQLATVEPSQGATCVICMDNLANLVCLPCKHLALCAYCGLQEGVSDCPICRSSISDKMQIYTP